MLSCGVATGNKGLPVGAFLLTWGNTYRYITIHTIYITQLPTATLGLDLVLWES